MTQNIKGEEAIEILRDPEIHKCFTDADNPVTKQVIYPLSDWFFNKEDIRIIEKAGKDDGQTAAAAVLLQCLIKCYKDQPDTLTLANFIEALENQKTNVKLVEMLYSKIEGPSHSVANSVINDIKARLQFMCENVAKAWGRLLSETSLEKCFVEPEIVEDKTGENGKKRKKGKSIKSYEQLFKSDTFGARIVIEGTPGIGKTTYVNKLALDWTWDDGTTHYSDGSRFLQSYFHVVFLIPLRTLSGGKSAKLAQVAEIQLTGCGSWLTNKFRNCPHNCLLILDAFDEYDGSCQEINKIITGSLFPQLKVIITTRPSHIQRLEKGPHWLSITGLTTKKKREQFLVKQGWDKLLERDMINHVLSGFCPLWNTPLYLAMLCVLYKAKKDTHFEPRQLDCFHVLVKLFTEHIMSRCVKEKGMQLSGEERLKLKSYLQQYAFQTFSENNPFLSSTLKSCQFIKKPRVEGSLAISQDIAKQAGKIGLIIIQEIESPITGENVENVSFVHQMFVEYYAGIEFGPIFTSCTNKEDLVQSVDKKLRLTDSPFSYFLAAECESYKQMLVKRIIDSFQNQNPSDKIRISKFPWLPEIHISADIFKKAIPKDITQLWFMCSRKDIKTFWELHYIKEICSIVQPTELTLENIFLGFHEDALDSIISSIKQLSLRLCSCKSINLPVDKVYANFTKLSIDCPNKKGSDEFMSLLKHFPNLHALELVVQITDHNMKSFCDSLQNMNQLRELQLKKYVLIGPESVSYDGIQFALANTIETSSLWKTLKFLHLNGIIVEIDTESSTDTETKTESATEILFNAISKCVQMEKLNLDLSQMKPNRIIQLAKTIETSALWKTLKELDFSWSSLDTETESSAEILFNAISKCVQLEKLNLFLCQMKPQSLTIIKDILQGSDNLKNSLKELVIEPVKRFLEPELRMQIEREDYLTSWKREVKLILPQCQVDARMSVC